MEKAISYNEMQQWMANVNQEIADIKDLIILLSKAMNQNEKLIDLIAMRIELNETKNKLINENDTRRI